MPRQKKEPKPQLAQDPVQQDQQQAAAKDAPASVTLSHPYGFRDEDDTLFFWQVGQVVTDPDEVALLVQRGAPLVALE